MVKGMRKMFKRFIAVALAGMLLASSGCSGGAGNGAAAYKSTFMQTIETLNPYLLTGNYSFVANTIDGLVENDRYGQYVPSLAQSWTSNDDDSVWTFKLREGLKWVNDLGQQTRYPVTAHDFVEALRYVSDPAVGAKNFSTIRSVISGLSDYYFALDDIDSGDDTTRTREDVYPTFDTDVGVKAIDDYTLEYTLSGSTPYFLSYLVIELFLPLNKAFLDTVGESYGTAKDKLLYNGGYYISDWDRDKQVIMTQNPYYWDKEHITVKTLEYQKVADEVTGLELFQRGEITSATLTAEQFTALKGTDWEKNIYLSEKSPLTYWFTFNYHSDNPEFAAMLQNVNFRKAILYAMDRVTLSALWEPENPAFFTRNTIIPEETMYNSKGVDYTDQPNLKPFKDQIPYDPAKAKDFMLKAIEESVDPDGTIRGVTPGYVDMLPVTDFNVDGKLPIDLVFVCTQDELEIKKSLLFREMMISALGSENINVILGYSVNSFSEEVFEPMNFDLVDDSYSFRFADPSANLARITTDGSMNEGGYDVPEYDALVERALAATDIDQRYELFSEAEKYMLENVYLMPYLTGGGSYNMTHEVPFTTPQGAFGLSKYKMKGAIIQDTPITAAEYSQRKEELEKEKASMLG
jgi:oligopeptide transport system substrate-binding protein